MPQTAAVDSGAARTRRVAAWRALAALLPLIVHPAPGAAAGPTAADAFPRSALQIHSRSGPNWFNIRIADTEAHRELGLMFVTQLPKDEGMLFPQDKPQLMTMWMKNTLIPLDMLFIDRRGRIVCLIANARPESLELLSCDKPVLAVLEIGGGEAERRGIQIGDTVVHATFHNR